jgi:hypothetical protein
MLWTGLVWLRIGKVESSCELGNDPSGSIKCWESTEWLHNLWQVLQVHVRQVIFPTYVNVCDTFIALELIVSTGLLNAQLIALIRDAIDTHYL